MRKIYSIILLFASLALADPQQPERGRLPDGRAYRLNDDGHQVVDYIAELETTVDALTQQVIALEDQLKAGGAIPAEASAPSCPPQVSCPAPVSCNNEIESAVKAAKINFQAMCDTRVQAIEAGYTQEIQTKEESIDSVRASVSEQAMMKQNNLEQQVNLLQIALNQEREKSALMQKEITETKEKLIQQQENPIVASIPQAAIEPQLAPVHEQRTNSALLSLRSAVVADAKRVQEITTQRDTLYRTDKISANGLSLKPQPAVSRNGNSIKDLRSKAESAISFRQLADIRTELSQIRARVQSDIDAVKRVQRLR